MTHQPHLLSVIELDRRESIEVEIVMTFFEDYA
jgi:hypothetical protein